MEHLTFDEEIDNVIGCIEYFMERMSDFLVDGNEGTLTEDEMVNDDAKKSLEFLHKTKEIVRGACVLAVYAGEDWGERQDAYRFGADGCDYLERYIEGGVELSDKFGAEDFYNDYSKYFVENIRPKAKKIFNTTQSNLVKYNGTKVEIGEELTDDERDTEVGRMWHITFYDGTTSDAFEDELS